MSLFRRLISAARGRGGLEDKLVLLGVISGGLFVTLVATLFVVQQRLGSTQRRLADEALPAEKQIGRLEASIGAAFGRQAQVSSTVDLKQLEPLRDRSAVEAPLRQAARAIAERLGEPARALDPHVAAFLDADAALYAAVARRHELQAAFEKELGAVDGDVRALVQDSQAVSGMLRLEYVLVLRGIAQSLAQGTVRMDLVRTAVLGDVRGALDATAELANAVLGLGWVAGKLGLASSSDAINSIAANELPQVRARIERVMGAIERRVGERPEVAARVHALAQRFADIAPRIMDEKRDGSLVALRRHVVVEAAAATAIQSQAVAAASALTADTILLQAEVARQVTASVTASTTTSSWARMFSVLVTLLGLAGCVVAARRTRQGIGDLNAINAGLESTVATRTKALVERDRAMQRVLDSMAEGLATVSLDGTLRPERSHAFTTWFADPGATPIWDILFPDDGQRAAMFACGFEQVAQDLLPFEVAVDQLPRQIERGGRTLELDLRPVYQADRLDAVLLVLSDVTDRIDALRAERAAREDHKVITNLLRDSRGFQRSVEEIQSLVAAVCYGGDPAQGRRALHTIKGNCAVLGFATMAERAHALEDELERDGVLEPSALATLEHAWSDSLKRIQEHVEHARGRIDIDSGDYRQLVEQLRIRADYGQILAMVEAWQLEPIGNTLQQLAGHARRLAEQLGKRVEVEVDSNRIRVGTEGLRAFCASLVHAVRNAVDHGIETPERRRDSGKPEVGRIRLSAARDAAGALVVTVTDDGAGVDVEQVRARAEARGLPCITRADVLESLFVEGVSTRADVTELSGRGVGTSAVRAACRELGGEASIRSEWGRGTELRCVLPASVLGAEASAAA